MRWDVGREHHHDSAMLGDMHLHTALCTLAMRGAESLGPAHKSVCLRHVVAPPKLSGLIRRRRRPRRLASDKLAREVARQSW